MTAEAASPSKVSEEKRRISRIEYFKQSKDRIMEKYLGTPIAVHTTRDYWMWVRENISRGEPPLFTEL